jgi:hypothetical protein
VEEAGIPAVAQLGPTLQHFDMDALKELAEGQTLEPGKHMREGLVVRPMTERISAGRRLILKLVSNQYLERKK